MNIANTWTPEQMWVLRKRYPIIRHTRDLVPIIGKSYEAIKSMATKMGIHREVANSGTSNATTEELDIIKENYLRLPLKTIGEMIGRSYTFVKGRMDEIGLARPEDLIEKIKNESRIQPGNVPKNKGRKQVDYMSKEAIERTKPTRFKKGLDNHNSLYDGAITIRHNHVDRGEKPHKHIRISKGKWKELQIYNWEKMNGPIPKGFLLTCRDGDTLNCDPSNWVIMSKKDNVLRNSGSRNLPDGYVAKTIVGKYKNPDLFKKVIANKPLIELKRQQLLLKRSINERATNTNKTGVHERAGV